MRKSGIAFLVLGMMGLSAMSLKELNHADKNTLMQIKGIGAAKAEAIIKARGKKGFKTLEDVLNVNGVGKALLSNITHDVGNKKSSVKNEAKKTDNKATKTKKKKEK